MSPAPLGAVIPWIGLPGTAAAALAALAGFTLRALAITRGLALPAYRG